MTRSKRSGTEEDPGPFRALLPQSGVPGKSEAVKDGRHQYSMHFRITYTILSILSLWFYLRIQCKTDMRNQWDMHVVYDTHMHSVCALLVLDS
uniref:Uncharacterized protein n=1 Tax=Panagrellus redivivus TaxID=6233 RepID=A0A7E4ZR08_PANRE